MEKYRITLVFSAGEVVSLIEEDDGSYLHEGSWTVPFPNTAEESLAFGLVEAYAQSDGPAQSSIYEFGTPVRIDVTKDFSAPIRL